MWFFGICISISGWKGHSRMGRFVQRIGRSLFEGNFRNTKCEVMKNWGTQIPKHWPFIRPNSEYWIFNSLSLNCIIRLSAFNICLLHLYLILHIPQREKKKSRNTINTLALTLINTNIQIFYNSAFFNYYFFFKSTHSTRNYWGAKAWFALSAW